MNPLEVLPDRKKQLFLARLNGEAVENGVIITSPLPTTPANAEKERSDSVSGGSVPTRLDNFASPKEGSRIEVTSPDAGSRSSSRLSVKENRQKVNIVAEKEGSAKRPLEFDNNSDSLDMREESKPKSKRTEIIIDSPEPEKSSVVVAGKKQSFKSACTRPYFFPSLLSFFSSQ